MRSELYYLLYFSLLPCTVVYRMQAGVVLSEKRRNKLYFWLLLIRTERLYVIAKTLPLLAVSSL